MKIMEGREVLDPSKVYITTIPDVSKKEVMKSSAPVSTSLVDLTRWDDRFDDNGGVASSTEKDKRGTKIKLPKLPLFSRHRLCINPEAMGVRFPLKLSSVLNIAGKEVTLLGVKILRKSPIEVVKALNSLLVPLENGFVDTEKHQKQVSKYLSMMKDDVLAEKVKPSTSSTSVDPDSISAQMIKEMIRSGCLENLIKKIVFLRFEDRKLFATLFCNLMRRQSKPKYPLVKFFERRPDILLGLISGYEDQSKVRIYGIILRDCLRYSSLCKMVLESERFEHFFEFLQDPVFEISSDAYMTFKELLTQHRKLSSDFILRNYENFFEKLDILIHCDNYVTQMYSLKLLTDMLLDRHNYSIMLKYVSTPKKLKDAMLLMSGSNSLNIQYEAFQAFKIFVGNPTPNPAVISILIKNRERLIKFLSNFQNDRKCDMFMDEKSFLTTRLMEISLSDGNPEVTPLASVTPSPLSSTTISISSATPINPEATKETDSTTETRENEL